MPFKENPSELNANRIINTGVILSEATATDIYKWLGDQLETLKSLKDAVANSPENADSKFFQTNESTIVSKNEYMFNTVYTSSSTYALQYKVSSVYTNNLSIYEKLKSSTLLDSFLSLPDNWNGYGAEEFTPDFIAAVKKIVFKLNKTPKIFTTGRNSIQFEYEKDNGIIWN